MPGLFKPWTFELTVVAVDYSLWDFNAWLPHSMRIEGQTAASVFKFPVSMDVSYEIESVSLAVDEEADPDRAAPAMQHLEPPPSRRCTSRRGPRRWHSSPSFCRVTRA